MDKICNAANDHVHAAGKVTMQKPKKENKKQINDKFACAALQCCESISNHAPNLFFVFVVYQTILLFLI